MPYKRIGYGRSKKRSRYPRKPKQNNYQYYANLAYQGYKYGRLAMSLLNTEKKHYDVTWNGTTITDAWQNTVLNDLSVGDGETNRDGNKVRMKSLQLKLSIVGNTSTPTNGCYVRIALVQLTKVRYPEFTESQVYPTDISSLRNMNNTTRYKVWYDKIISLDMDVRPRYIVDKFWKMSIPVNFYSSTATDIENNAFALMYLTNLSTNQPLMTGNARIRFIDN